MISIDTVTPAKCDKDFERQGEGQEGKSGGMLEGWGSHIYARAHTQMEKASFLHSRQ